MRKKKRPIRLDQASVVGTIHTPGGFAEAASAPIDVAEVRVDILPLKKLRAEDLGQIPASLLLTVRRPDEGAGRTLTEAERTALYLEFLPHVEAVDLEGRSIRSQRRVLMETKQARRILVLSFHDFKTTPSVKVLRRLEALARDAGADIVKFATTTETPEELARLLTLLDGATGPLSVMGMGRLGRASRLLFAKAGSVLNYGWLHRPQVPGQWSAREFRELLDRV